MNEGNQAEVNLTKNTFPAAASRPCRTNHGLAYHIKAKAFLVEITPWNVSPFKKAITGTINKIKPPPTKPGAKGITNNPSLLIGNPNDSQNVIQPKQATTLVMLKPIEREER
ncbi:MAG: hypothetical protein GKR96_02000 [Gammaproteobacteria bacterium]|nr:hypothetical protein [Gammaproteobacteria bacterium]